MTSRFQTTYLVLATLFLFTPIVYGQDRIDRQALVTRHCPIVHEANALSPLSVGNGEFAFTVDVTGLQSFPEAYLEGIPLSTQSHWGWHSFPNPKGYKLTDALETYDTYGRSVPYATQRRTEPGQVLRASPHRLGLGHIGLDIKKTDGTTAVLEDIQQIHQTLDLWNGRIISHFAVDGQPVEVLTCCHPTLDAIAVRITSSLITEDRLHITLHFAYGSDQFGKAPEDWTKPDRHQTFVRNRTATRIDLHRQLDQDEYAVGIETKQPYRMTTEIEKHLYTLTPSDNHRQFEFLVAFASRPLADDLPGVDDTFTAAAEYWQSFWATGGAIDLSASTDPRALELERRIVLSQYVLAIQSAGTKPPQETGLTFNSWHGKFHLEMHWWHAVNFALWDRIELLEKSLPWYTHIMPRAAGTAKLQGYDGVRWPKMVGPEGRESPSDVGAMLIWQQPHPIYYAELCYRTHPNRETLERYKDIVFETARFMASYAHWLEGEQRYVLGPPVIPAQESHPARQTMNPTYELEYWDWALKVAQLWRVRLGMPRQAKWDHVIQRLSDLPSKDGIYLMAENRWNNRDHPSLLAALGVLPGSKADSETMHRTLKKILTDWQWETTWGWDFPMIAMTAARVGEPEIAIDALLKKTVKNTYLVNGHNYQSPRLPIYLPGNGGLLTAVAMMAAGWDNGPQRHAPGFPNDGQWVVRWENLKPMP